MPVVPSKDVDAIQYFEDHVSIWSEAGPTIGVTVPQADGVSDATAAARTAYQAQQQAKQAAKNSTVAFQAAMRVMRTKGGDLIKTVKAFAANSADPSTVYTKAQIEPPAPPTSAPLPGQPTDFNVQLQSDGAVNIKWKSTNSAASGGVYFAVRRKLAGETSFTLVGTTGSKSFVDATIPTGTTSLTYIVQGFRGQSAGTASEQLSLQFGSAGSGAVNTTLRMAA